MSLKKLLTPVRFGTVEARNRIVLPPLTRNRAGPGDVPSDLQVTYYTQRASAGLIITEGSQIMNHGKGYASTPGIYSEEQTAGWKRVVDSVHAKGGKIFLQLWHCGRVTHTSFHPEAGLPVGPSPIAAAGTVMTASFAQEPYEVPRELSKDDIKAIVAQYRFAAENCKKAGFDGVEIHAANGYLINQFLEDGTNKRTDEFGGSFENRARFLLQIVDAVKEVYPTQVGVRLSPNGLFNDMSESDWVNLYTYVAAQLDTKGLAYLHLIEPRFAAEYLNKPELAALSSVVGVLRPVFRGAIIAAGGYTPETAEAAVEVVGGPDAIAFGRHFIANPDLPARIEKGAELNRYDRTTFYGGNEKGYTDYPFLSA